MMVCNTVYGRKGRSIAPCYCGIFILLCFALVVICMYCSVIRDRYELRCKLNQILLLIIKVIT